MLAAAAGFAALCACSQSLGPAGWQIDGASGTAWSSGSGAAAQHFTYEKSSFNGTLQDMASAQVANVVLQFPGTKFVSSDTFTPCPGLAAAATFTYRDGRVLQRVFAVASGKAVVVTLIKPKRAATSPEAESALEHDVCVPPA